MRCIGPTFCPRSVTQAAVEFYLEAERDPAHPQLVNILNTILTDEVNAHEGTRITATAT